MYDFFHPISRERDRQYCIKTSVNMAGRESIDLSEENEEFSDDFEDYSDATEDELDGIKENVNNVLNGTQETAAEFLSDDKSIDENLDSDQEGVFLRPETLLAKLRKQRLDLDFEASKFNAIKCLALCKIIYGENHEKVAAAHMDVANTYIKGKYYPLQALKHSTLARDILLIIKKQMPDQDKDEYLLQNIYYVMGRANFQNNKIKAAENCLLKAKLIADNTHNAMKKYLDLKILILSYLAKVSAKFGQFGQAIEYIEEAQDINSKIDGNQNDTSINLFKQIVEIEFLNKDYINVLSASEACGKALELSIETYGKESKEAAEIFKLKVQLEMKKEVPDYTIAVETLGIIKDIYQSLGDMVNWIGSQQMLCKIYLQQNKFDEAKITLESCIESCETLKGDMSLKSAELYELMGSILYSQNKLKKSVLFFTKAEDIYRGKKKYKTKQDKILKLIDMIRKGSKDDKLKTTSDKLKDRPRFM